MHIFLIGFMCAGKSRVGRELAPLLDLPFKDLDRVIEQRVGPIKPFFEREGEAMFRKEEELVLAELIDGPTSVIATGGGTPCEGNNLGSMKAAGTVVWLNVSVDVLMPRIVRSGGDRPMLAGLTGSDLQERVQQMLTERLPVYQQADVMVDGSVPPEKVALAIRAKLVQVR